MQKDLSFFLASEMDIEDIKVTCFLDKFAMVLLFTICTCSHLCADNIHTCNTLQCVQDNTEIVHGYKQAHMSFLCSHHMQIVDWLLPFYTPAFRLKLFFAESKKFWIAKFALRGFHQLVYILSRREADFVEVDIFVWRP